MDRGSTLQDVEDCAPWAVLTSSATEVEELDLVLEMDLVVDWTYKYELVS